MVLINLFFSPFLYARIGLTVLAICVLFVVSGCAQINPPISTVKHTSDLDGETVKVDVKQDSGLLAAQLSTDVPSESLDASHVNTQSKDNLTSKNAPPNVWDAMRKGFRLQKITDKTAKQRVQKEIDWFLSHPNYIKTVNKRSEPYIAHILREVSKRKLPYELTLLPFVESGFDPKAHSYANASGLWQFMPKTGKSLGLQQDWWRDDRRDVVLSTDAALTYLQMLNKRFNGDWLHALAAYNSGAGNVSKAIRKNKRRGKSTSYWHLDLPKETAHYVPKLLAIAHIYNHPQKYNVVLQPIKYQPYFEVVDVQSQLDLSTAAKLASISVDELMRLNPSFNQFAIHPEGPYTLLLPTDKVDDFNAQLAVLPKDQRVTWQRYTIKSGDSLSVIARKYKVSVGVIQKVNALASHTIRAGKTLLIPTGAFHAAYLPNKTHLSLQSNKVKKRYTVKSGDSLWKIARTHNVKIKHITRWNNLSIKKPIKPGQTLTLWINKV